MALDHPIAVHSKERVTMVESVLGLATAFHEPWYAFAALLRD